MSGKMEGFMLPTAAPAHALANAILVADLPENLIQQRVQRIRRDLLAHSNYLREPDFKAIHPLDLEFLFGAYDEQFFAGLCRRALDGKSLHFRLSRRMTHAGGKTARFTSRVGEVSYEISIASTILFDGFGGTDRLVTVCGIECQSRLEALQRIFEHEIVHLVEQLCWGTSNCAAERFQAIAARFFLHRAHTHNLITRRERAAVVGIRIGSLVTFEFEGRQLTGRVNRITKRATVLVADPDGVSYSDGLKYRTYYVPLASLKSVMAHPAG
jgi:hypothetical protein